MSIKGALKGDIVNNAYSLMRVSGLTTDPTPEELEDCLGVMESFMHTLFTVRSVCVDYAFEDEPDPNSPHNVERAFWEPIAANVAIRMIPDFNKTEHPRLTKMANSGLRGMGSYSAVQKAREVPYPRRMPRGSGNTLRVDRWNRWMRPCPIAPATCDTNTMWQDDIADYTEHFDAYLGTETIASYTIEADEGLTIQSDSNTDTDVLYRIKAVGSNSNGNDGFLQVTIVVTTSGGRVETRKIDFIVEGTTNG
jgi:hypothetical protein